MSFTSCWRLLSSSETAEGARATGRSLLAGLLLGEADEIAVIPYFKGGFKVEFRLSHEASDWLDFESTVVRSFERVCGEWTRTQTESETLELWCGDLVFPHAEALDVELRRATAG